MSDYTAILADLRDRRDKLTQAIEVIELLNGPVVSAPAKPTRKAGSPRPPRAPRGRPTKHAAIVAALQAGPLSPRVLGPKVGLTPAGLRKALAQMAQSGQVRLDGATNNRQVSLP